MLKFAAGAALTLVLAVIVGHARGEEGDESQHATLAISTRSLRIVDDQNRVRIVLGVTEPPMAGAFLKFLDTKGKEKIHLSVQDEGPAQMWMHDADGAPFLQLIGIGDPDRKVRGGFLRLGGMVDGELLTSVLWPNRLEFWREEQRRHVFPEVPEAGK
jgi:hypothetical protein